MPRKLNFKEPCETRHKHKQTNHNLRESTSENNLDELEAAIRELKDKLLRLREELRALRQIHDDEQNDGKEEKEDDNEDDCVLPRKETIREDEPAKCRRKRISRGVQCENAGEACVQNYNILLRCFKRQNVAGEDGRISRTSSPDNNIENTVNKKASSPRDHDKYQNPSVSTRNDAKQQHQQQNHRKRSPTGITVIRDDNDKDEKKRRNRASNATTESSVTIVPHDRDRRHRSRGSDRSNEINELKASVKAVNGNRIDVEPRGNDLMKLIDKRGQKIKEKSELRNGKLSKDAMVKDTRHSTNDKSLLAEGKIEKVKDKEKETKKRDDPTKTSETSLEKKKSKSLKDSDSAASKREIRGSSKRDAAKNDDGSKMKSLLKNYKIMNFFEKEKTKKSNASTDKVKDAKADKKTKNKSEKKRKVDDDTKNKSSKLTKQSSKDNSNNDSQFSFKQKLSRCASELNQLSRKASKLFRK